MAVDLIALASIVVFPTLADLQAAFPNIPADKIGHDLAYPAMLSLLPEGLLGLVAASLLAAFMSTMSTQLNLGASYLSTILGALHSTGCHRCGAGACGPIGDRGFVDARQRARFAADGCWASLQPAVAHWRRHRRPVHPALVLVAHQCVDRVGGDGRLVGCCGLFHLVHDGLDIVELAAHEKLIWGSLLTTLVWWYLLTPPSRTKP